jgi:hypothetical protein
VGFAAHPGFKRCVVGVGHGLSIGLRSMLLKYKHFVALCEEPASMEVLTV